MGLAISEAVRIFLKRAVMDQALPLALKVPNAATRAAMEESRRMMRSARARCETPGALFDDLEEARQLSQR